MICENCAFEIEAGEGYFIANDSRFHIEFGICIRHLRAALDEAAAELHKRTNLSEAHDLVIEAARVYCAATEDAIEAIEELAGTVGTDAPVEFMELHEAVAALRLAETGSYTKG